MTPLTSDWCYKNENLQQRAYLLTSLVRVGIAISGAAYEFCDFTIKNGWTPPLNDYDCDREVLDMFGCFMREVWNG